VTTNDLTTDRKITASILDNLALAGGHFGALRIIATFFFSFFIGGLRNIRIMEEVSEVNFAPPGGGDKSLDQTKRKAIYTVQQRRKEFRSAFG